MYHLNQHNICHDKECGCRAMSLVRDVRATPRSDEAIDSFPDFFRKVRSRLDTGRREYGDASFSRPVADILREIAEELEDQAGWAFIGWCRIRELIAAAESLSAGLRPHDAPPHREAVLQEVRLPAVEGT